ncbi:MAG: proton-conducting transporter membrane subunit, partial [Alphaproteobacteria bacterium]
MQTDMIANLTLMAPELLIAVGALALLMVGAFAGEKSYRLVNGLSVAVLVLALVLVAVFPQDGHVFGRAFISDSFSRFMKVLTLVGSIVTLIMSTGFAKIEKFDKFEFPILVLLANVGMLLMVSANDTLSLYLSLELQSLALYVVAAINRDSIRSTEAGLKYFVLGAL